MELTKYSQLKHEMRVRCKIKSEEIKDAKLRIDEEGRVFICQNVVSGMLVGDMLGYEHSYCFCGQGVDKEDWDVFVKDLRSYKKGLRDMEIGDIIIDGYGGEREVLDVREEIFFVSSEGGFDVADSCCYRFKEVESYGWKLKDVEEEETHTITLDGKEVEISSEIYESIKISIK